MNVPHRGLIRLRDLLFTKPTSMIDMRNCLPEEIKMRLDKFDTYYGECLDNFLVSNRPEDIAQVALDKFDKDVSQALWHRIIFQKLASKYNKMARMTDTQQCKVFNDRLQKLPLVNSSELLEDIKSDVNKLLGIPNSRTYCSRSIFVGETSTQERFKGAIKTPSVNQLLKEQATSLTLLKKLGLNHLG